MYVHHQYTYYLLTLGVFTFNHLPALYIVLLDIHMHICTVLCPKVHGPFKHCFLLTIEFGEF